MLVSKILLPPIIVYKSVELEQRTDQAQQLLYIEENWDLWLVDGFLKVPEPAAKSQFTWKKLDNWSSC